MSNPIHGWHFIPADGKMAQYGNSRRFKIVEGKTYSVKPPVVLCGHGLHASERVRDALQPTRRFPAVPGIEGRPPAGEVGGHGRWTMTSHDASLEHC